MEHTFLLPADSRVVHDGKFLVQKYAVLHFNVFCEGFGKDPSVVQHYPAEFGAVTFSISGGLGKIAIAVINPGNSIPPELIQ